MKEFMALPDSDRIIPLDTYEVWRFDDNWDPSGSFDDLMHAESLGSAVLVKVVVEGMVTWNFGDSRLPPPTICGSDTQ